MRYLKAVVQLVASLATLAFRFINHLKNQMKISKFLMVGTLVLAFIFVPVITHGQTVQDLLSLIAKLQAQLALLLQQQSGCQPGVLFNPVSGARCSDDTAGCAWGQYYNSLTGARCSDAIFGCAGGPVGYNSVTGLQCTWPPPATPTPIPVPVAPSLNVLYPNGGEVFNSATSLNILFSWASNYAPKSPVAYLENNISGVVSSKNLSFNQAVEKQSDQFSGTQTLPSGQYRVGVCDLGTDNPKIPGKYLCDWSDSTFQLISSVPTNNRPPSISGVSGPTTLNAGQSGTWSVTASDPENGSLSYSAVWGDEVTAGTSGAVQQTATFSHTYANAGTYYPTFTVTDNSGQSARTSLSVVVGGSNLGIPKISSISPTSATIGSTVTIYGSNLTNPTDVGFIGASLSNSPIGGENHTNIYPYKDGALSFVIPSTLRQWGGGERPDTYVSVVPGRYYFILQTSAGKSEPMFFDVIGTTPPQPTPTITSSSLPNGAIDAAQATSDSAVRGSLPWSSIGLIFSSQLPTSGSLLDYFSISSTNAGGAPAVSQVRWAAGNSYEVGFSRQILPGERIRITHKPSGGSVCLGFLPGDVDGSGWFLNTDLAKLNAWVGTAEGAAQPLYKTDINRDGVFNQADVTRAGELLSAPGVVRSLPACPAPLSVAPTEAQIASAISAINSLLQSLRQVLNR